MKRIRTALCLILAAALLAGCAFLPSDSESETPAPTDPLTGLAPDPPAETRRRMTEVFYQASRMEEAFWQAPMQFADR